MSDENQAHDPSMLLARLTAMRRASALSLTILLTACGPTGFDGKGNSGGSSGSGSGGVGGYSGSTGTGGFGGSIDPNPDARNCGVQNFDLQRGLPPDLLIVLDQSGSMTQSPIGGGASKW